MKKRNIENKQKPLHKATGEKREVFLTVFNAVCAILSVLAAIISVLLLNESNKIAQKAQLPDVRTFVHSRYATYSDLGRPWCNNTDGGVDWETNLIAVIDLSNVGGKTASIIAIDSVENTINPSAHLGMDYNFFKNSQELDDWINKNQAGHRPIQLGINMIYTDTINFAGLPITMDVGKTVRIVLHGVEKVKVEKPSTGEAMNINYITQTLANEKFVSTVSFLMSDGSKSNVDIQVVPGPYGGDKERIMDCNF